MAPPASSGPEAVRSDPTLWRYGAVLALAHTLTALSWTGDRSLPDLLAAGRPAVCWPVFEACAEARVLPASVWAAFPWGYGLLGLVTAGLFATRRTRAGMGLLAVLFGLGLAVMLQDYRLRLNQHLMHGVVTAAFLKLPDKRRTAQGLVLAFYVWAGTLKLNADWLTGAALGPDGMPGIPASVLPAACAYVVFLELVGVFGLLGPRWLQWATLFQLAVFHALSWGVVGFYYPLLMAGLLSIFPLSWASPDPSPRTWAPWGAVAAFSVLQLVPLAAPGDPALTSQGRIVALHMFDAHVVCEASMVVHGDDGRTTRVPIPTDRGPARMRCDPVVHWGVARHTCRQPGVHEVDLTLRSRRSTQTELTTVIDLKGFCAANPTFDLFSNDWIHTDP
ncbi:MAG: hypothetical protein R3F61_23795 [Myxococcota bacterium]